MSNHSTLPGCNGSAYGTSVRTVLPVSPFYAPRYHFGMLLGVDDFESEQSYHRGKSRLHNSWLHGEGVVWGLGVDAPRVEGGDGSLKGEIRVQPGLALDAAGRELFLAATACVGVPAWYELHRDDPELQAIIVTGEGGTLTFDAHVVARFRACLSRPVPAISEPCVGAGNDTAYSRAQETIELLLRPGRAPDRSDRYHRLRLLFGLEEPRVDEEGTNLPADDVVVEARIAVQALAPAAQPAAYLQALRRFAALDEIGMEPFTSPTGETSFFADGDDTVVVLADVTGITLERDGEGYQMTGAEVNTAVRRSHIATSTIQELLVGPIFAAAASGAGTETPAPAPADAGGPRIVPTSVQLEGEAVSFATDKPLSKASVAREAFSISAYDNRDGWREVEIARDPILDRSAKKIRIELSSGFGGNLIRIIARGTGPAPILGTNLIPLAGPVGGAPGGRVDGHDFVLMLKRSET